MIDYIPDEILVNIERYLIYFLIDTIQPILDHYTKYSDPRVDQMGLGNHIGSVKNMLFIIKRLGAYDIILLGSDDFLDLFKLCETDKLSLRGLINIASRCTKYTLLKESF